MSRRWSKAQDDEVARLWSEGVSARLIGIAMSETKNAIVGRAHRLGMAPRPSPVAASGEPRPPRAVTRRALPAQIAAGTAAPGRALPAQIAAGTAAPVVKIIQRTCQWIMNDRYPWVFCPELAVPKTSWCDPHGRRVWIKRRELV
jgi:hypothetical protein